MKTNQTNIEKLDNKTFVVKLIISQNKVAKTYQEVLKSIQANFEAKGFRKGKTPLDVVEKEISFEKLFEEVASKLISQEYVQIIKENNLKPIIQPQVKFNKQPVDFKTDWEIEITACELPEINLDKNYLDKIEKIKSDSKITDENQKTDEIVKSLISSAKLDLPAILIESDLQHQLSQLVNQAQQAGISVNQYLESQKTNIEDYRKNLEKRIIQEWTVNLAIQKIAQDEKIEISPAEIKEITDKNPSLSQNLNMVNYILTQQKVFDFLKK
ncbi:MAG: trigger factor [Candidatus Shapirobacteria bacterium]|nr:trigger factor [Candidatus Shapirobacteria bacterium]